MFFTLGMLALDNSESHKLGFNEYTGKGKAKLFDSSAKISKKLAKSIGRRRFFMNKSTVKSFVLSDIFHKSFLELRFIIEIS
jgi:hypothetical protein